MATHPIVRNTEEEAVRSPQELEALIGPGVSPEHRAILLKALTRPAAAPSLSCCRSMPNVGEDSDFARSKG